MAFSYEENGTSEPLLGEKKEKHAVPERISPYSKATLLQLVTFSWLNPLFAVGAKKPLEQDDVPDVDLLDSAGYLSQNLSDCIKQVKSKGRQGNPLYKAMVLFVRRKVAINALFAIVCASASYVGPYLIEDFVNFLSNKRNRRLESGYLLALGFLGAKVVETISQRQWIFGARQLGLRLRAALISHIYQKGLHLSSQTRQGRTSGEIINYMNHASYIRPSHEPGAGSLAALGATLVVMLCNIPLTRIQKRYQSKIMEAKDDRMRTTSEVLRNMKTIKLQAWDNQFLSNLKSLREKEYNHIWKSLRLAALSAFIFWGSPTFISVVTFSACMLMNIELTAGRVLSALATFRMLQDPIFNLPDLLNIIAQAKVSADRITTYLQEEEIQHDAIEYVPRDESEFDVEIQDGNFVWSSELDKPTLENINLKVRRGMKVAICGTVGSGKSSLLSCILGEMKKVSGEVKVSGTKAYVPQSPWILTGDIRENILFGNTYDAAKYHQTVKACTL
ncbi:hypothetical protein MLD38_019158 [Melastoma candidum]|uniref:Uncharacterized protein n=1 Tax=Melastoma candidum TaxID=119954 RepID=A0ACB9QVJ3_9MYRT|nr:hypothetical protein MLD38_019158 [Melastoma candidum]